MGKPKKNRSNDNCFSKIAIVTAIISLLNGLITLITKIIEMLSE